MKNEKNIFFKTQNSKTERKHDQFNDEGRSEMMRMIMIDYDDDDWWQQLSLGEDDEATYCKCCENDDDCKAQLAWSRRTRQHLPGHTQPDRQHWRVS